MISMKVCMVTPFRPERDGVGDCSVHLVPELEKRGADVEIVSREISEQDANGSVRRFIYRKSSSRNLIKQLIEELKSLPRTLSDIRKTIGVVRDSGCDIVHVQHEPGAFNLFYTPLLLGRLRKMGVKTVVTMHGRDYSLLRFLHQNFLYPRADVVTVHTETHRDLIGRSNVVVVPMGINSIEVPRGWEAHKRVLFFGFISPHKGVEYLLQAFKKVLEKIPDSELLIHGPVNPAHKVEAEYQKRIQGMISGLGIGDRTTFVSKYTEREDLPSIGANIVVFPYSRTYSAGQSAALLDSIGSGKAVIVTRVPGIFERVVDGENGFVVEPEDADALADAMLKLLGDEDLLRRICRNNVEKSKGESWGYAADSLLKVYSSLI